MPLAGQRASASSIRPPRPGLVNADPHADPWNWGATTSPSTPSALAPSPPELFRQSNPEGAPQTERILKTSPWTAWERPEQWRVRQCVPPRLTTASITGQVLAKVCRAPRWAWRQCDKLLESASAPSPSVSLIWERLRHSEGAKPFLGVLRSRRAVSNAVAVGRGPKRYFCPPASLKRLPCNIPFTPPAASPGFHRFSRRFGAGLLGGTSGLLGLPHQASPSSCLRRRRHHRRGVPF